MEPDIRLLLSCALRPEVIAPGLQASIAAEVTDWARFVDKAGEHLALPFVQRSLPAFGDVVPMEVRAEIDFGFRAGAAQNLRLAATLAQMHRSWFEPQGMRFAAVKGIALAARYYEGLAARSCRDLDILIAPDAFAATIAHLADNGFRLCRPYELPADPHEHRRHIEALCDLNREVSLRSPAGDLIDVHRSLDLTGADFPTSELLDRAQAIDIIGASIPTLSTTDMFVYACYHHSRHNWTRLHWLADIAQIAAAPDFDREAVRVAARRCGMEKLVAACLDMPGILAEAVRGGEPWHSGLAGRMATECLTYLQPDAESPMTTHHRRIDDRGFRIARWFEMTGEEWRQREGITRKLRAIARSFTPSWQMYRSLPLPRGLRWLYVPLRIGSHIIAYTGLGRIARLAGHWLPHRRPHSQTAQIPGGATVSDRAAEIVSETAPKIEKDAG